MGVACSCNAMDDDEHHTTTAPPPPLTNPNAWHQQYMHLQHCVNRLPLHTNACWTYKLPVEIKYTFLIVRNRIKKKRINNMYIPNFIVRRIFAYCARTTYQLQGSSYILPFSLMNNIERIVWLCEKRRTENYRRNWKCFCQHHAKNGHLNPTKHRLYL